MNLRRLAGLMMPQEISRRRQALGLSPRRVARRLAFHQLPVERWGGGAGSSDSRVEPLAGAVFRYATCATPGGLGRMEGQTTTH